MQSYILRDAGDKVEAPTMSGGMISDKYYQKVNFDITQLPELGNWKVGETYQLIIEVKQLDHSIDTDEDGTDEEATFEIQKVGAYSPEVDNYGAAVKEKLKLQG